MTGFVVAIIGALFLLCGLIVDGGLALGARVRALNEAQEAARSGAQQLDLAAYRRDATVRVDATRARTAALSYIAATPDTAAVEVVGDTVTVTVRAVQPTQILGLAGLRSIRVTGRATAVAQRGVTGVIR
ncbi:pilus assembly protein TadG-related protein [Spongiactinospora rosea]|uniref:pilus assembly protein TadG-related protein n=1 Tax=Spongiactinospora rosea TaxID=2248750 RepID=UPI0018F7AA62|nr:pilus assembly protein TadG-related protein [Spongiactinospora rosea]